MARDPASGAPVKRSPSAMRFNIPDKKKLAHQITIPIRWGDMDALGHVNNAVYFSYFETVRTDWFNSLGLPTGPEGAGPVIVNAFCTFHRQLTFPGSVLLRLFTSDPGRSSFETWVTLERTDLPGVLYASGGGTTVWFDFPGQKSVPLPDWLRSRLT
jgi:acyl-CoA thioester hydrolase